MENNTVNKIVDFIKSIGIDVCFEPILTETFVPGITIRSGGLVVDIDNLSYPGDLLHEAGHVAVTSLQKRPSLNDNVDTELTDGGNEMAAIAWSYAACLYIGIDPAIVFHADGYKGGSSAILENFNEGKYFGVPLLQFYGMSYQPNQAMEKQTEPFPQMINWLSQH
jgi:hypothetical protein